MQGPIAFKLSHQIIRGYAITIVSCVLAIGWRSAEKGAATSLYVATEPGLNFQQCHYYSDCRVRHSSPLSRYT